MSPRKIPQLINAETKKVADQLTAPGGVLEDVKNEIKKALDDIHNTFDGFEDAISDIYTDINEVSIRVVQGDSRRFTLAFVII